MAVGHLHSVNLRTRALGHLAAAEGLHEHDMGMLRRVTPRGLRQGAPKGKRVVVVYDTAAICHQFWKRCRQECAVYFISRVKERMVFEWLHSEPVDPSDPRNAGVVEDRRREQRSGEAREKCRKEGSVMSSLLLEARGATQTSLKFIRWLRQCLRDHAAEAAAVPRLMALYANL